MAEKIGQIAERILEKVKPLPRRFEQLERPKDDVRGIFYFHQPGDFLYGFLLCKQTVETIHYPFRTYKIRALEGRQDGVDLKIAEDGEVIEIPANIVARRLIDDNDLIGSCVKIVFTGKKGQKKYYNVFKDKGIFLKDEEQKYGRTKKTRKKRTG